MKSGTGRATTHPNLGAALDVLRTAYPDQFSTSRDIRAQHTNTLTWLPSEPPDAVVYPSSTDDVARIIEVAASHDVPIIPFGAGTSLEGHVNAPLGGISLDLSAMNRILNVNDADMDCTVEAGVSHAELNTYLRDTGLFFSVDPGTDQATLGGMAATRASGTTSVRYGTMRDNVIRITAVLANGKIIRTGSRARKSAAGYDLTRLLLGSEGTLGIITDLTLKLHPIPEAISAMIAPFTSLEFACQATMDTMAYGIVPARIELLDAVQMRTLNTYSHLSYEEVPTLFLEFHGTIAANQEQTQKFKEIAISRGSGELHIAEDQDERRKLWKARHDALWAVKAAWPGRQARITDVCVPISRLAECVAETEEDIKQFGLIAPIAGHVGDGNFHALAMIDPNDKEEEAKLNEFCTRLARRAIAMDGTCTGEHGIGEGKIELLAEELGEGADVMRDIKNALDPRNILNPGKLFPKIS